METIVNNRTAGDRMSTRRWLGLTFSTQVGYLVTLAAGVAIGAAAIGSASAAPAAPTAPSTVTHHYALAASAFAPDSLKDVVHDYDNNWDPTALGDLNGERCYNAGLSLPVDATLRSVTVFYEGSNSSLSFEINRQALAPHLYKVLVQLHSKIVTTMTYTAKTLKFSKNLAKVDMRKYAYSAGVCPAGSSTFSGLIITYTEPVH